MTNRNVLILGLLGLVVIVILYYFLLLSPLLNRLDEQAQAREEKQNQLAQVQQDVDELEEIKKNSPEIQRQILELSKRIPAQPQVPTFVVQAQEIADASGVTQLSVDPEPALSPEGGGDYTVVPVTMQFEGTYDEMQDFLLRTRNLARLVTVTNVSYCRDPQIDEGHSCSVTPPEGVEEEATTLNPSVEAGLLVELQAELYYQPTGATEGVAPPTIVPETTTPAETPEATSGG